MKILHIIFVIIGLIAMGGTASCSEDRVADSHGLEVFATGLTTPVSITHAGDNRLFVVDQHGKIVIVDQAGNVKPQPFLDITDRVTYGGEKGLLGLAFHPQFKTNGYFYVNYTGGDSTFISRFSVSSSDPDRASASGEIKLMTIYQPYSNHNGGGLAFGPDGYLYIALGDGGSGGDPGNRAQNMMEYLGKMLRIDVNNGNPYAIPQSNPYAGSNNARKEIWASGLRNPWRFSFDRLTGDLWIADVGQNAFEEINFQPAASKGGENYGWRCYEGNEAFNTSGCGPSGDFAFPVHVIPHGPECSVTGGYMYRGPASSPFYGRYFFTDYCSDRIWTLRKSGDNWVAEEYGTYTGNNFSTFGEDAQGQLYVAGIKSGTIFRISDNAVGLKNAAVGPLVKITSLPGSGKVRIENVNTVASEMLLSIFDATGIRYHNSRLRSTEMEIDISPLPKGIYFLNVVSEGRSMVHKLIKD